MKGWVQVLLGIILVALLLQCGVYIRGKALLSYMPFNIPPPGGALPQLPEVTQDPATERQTEQPNATGLHRHHPYPFLINPPDACAPAPELVIVVVTAVAHFGDRQAVRDTWGSYAADAGHNTSLVFLLGTTPSAELQARLVNESEQHGDIVQEDFVDSYRNLTLKSVALLKWVTVYCNASTYVLKADDDMYVNVSNLLAALRAESEKHQAFVMGHVFVGARPVQNKDSKWYTPVEVFGEKVYPRYTSGTSYAMSTSAARLLYRASAEVPFFWLEDIYITGLCSRKAGVIVVHHGGFTYKKPDIDGCHFRRAITGHRYSAADKRSIFRLVNDPKLKC